MGLFNQLAGALGNDIASRFLHGNANFQQPGSPDFNQFARLLGRLPQHEASSLFGHAARQEDPHDYDQHVTPGASGTDPLGALGSSGLATLASILLSNLSGSFGGTNPSQLLQMIPGLRSTDPHRMSTHDVARLASWTRQHRPDAFARTAAQAGQQNPSLLQGLLSNKMLTTAAASIAAKLFGGNQH